MVQIPTTQRQFHNTTTKANTLALYADALKPAVQNANKIFMQQQKIKIDTRATQARIEADDYVNNMRLQYQGNPDSPEFKQAISGGLHDIFERYGQDIDPMAKGEWNLTANKMTGAYDLSNNEWIIKQRADNAKVDVAENINANLQLARRAGSNGNWQAGVEDFKNSYGQLFEYAKNNMGETDARKLLKDYEQQYMTSYINGMAEKNPAAALKALEQPEIMEMIGDEQAQKTVNRIVKKQHKIQTYNDKVKQYDYETKLSEQLDSMPTDDALQLLGFNENNVSGRYYRAKRRALLSQKAVNATSQPKTITDILRNISQTQLNADNKEDFLDSSQQILATVEDKYADGEISAQDKQMIMNFMKNKPMSVAEAVKNQKKPDEPVLASFSFSDADKYIKENYAGNDADEVLLDYARQISSDDTLSNTQKRKVADSLLSNATLKTQSRVNLRIANASYYPSKDEQAFMNKAGYSYEDVVYTAQQRGMSVRDVLNKLNEHKMYGSE